MSKEEQRSVLQERLQVATEKRQKTQAMIKDAQKEVEYLFRNVPVRPREKLTDLEQKIGLMERERTINSMSLQEEKDILRQIQKLEKTKRDVEEFEEAEVQAKGKKREVLELREVLKKSSSQISQLRVELSLLEKAIELNCSVEEIVGMQVSCPASKLGQVIGKKGGNVKELEKSQGVSVNIASSASSSSGFNKNGDNDETRSLHILGTLESLDAAASDIGKLLSKTEEAASFPASLSIYLSSRGISALKELRERHPDVYIGVVQPSSSSGNAEIRLRGIPEDIESVKRDLQTFSICREELQVTNAESALLIGKQGTTINKFVDEHQAAIKVANKVDGSADKKTTVSVFGPFSCVKTAVLDMQELLSNHREETSKMSIHPVVKEVLKMNKGEGIQNIYKKVAARCREVVTPSLASVSFGEGESTILIKAKAMALSEAIQVVKEEIGRLDDSIVTIDADAAVIPALIGKGGENIKAMTWNTKKCTVEFDRQAGKVQVCGLDDSEAKAVVDKISEFLALNVVETLLVDEEVDTFQSLFRRFTRSAGWKEVNELVFITTVDNKPEILLRGKKENIKKAISLVKEFISENHQRDIPIDNEEHVSALLRGGKQSKIVQLASDFDVNLSFEQTRSVVIARGEKDKVSQVVEAIRKFLFGGDGIVVSKLPLDDQSIGIVIGKEGKTKAVLEELHHGVSITVQSGSDHSLVLRGPDAEVRACRAAVVKTLATARVTQRIGIPTDKKEIAKPSVTRRIGRSLPVQISAGETEITLRGVRSDIEYAVALFNEQITGTYEGQYVLQPSQFKQIEASIGHFARIEAATGTKIKTDEEKVALVISGSHVQVQQAKRQVLKILEFLLGDTFASVDLPVLAVNTVGQASSLADIDATSGATVVLDRDINALIVTASEAMKVARALASITPKIAETDSQHHTIRLDASENWIVSAIIGKGGSQIKKLRKRTTCSIDIDSRSNTVTLTSEDAEQLAEARNLIETLIEKERSKCLFVDIPSNDMPAFLGRKGARIKEFQATHNSVEVQVIKGQSPSLRLSGDADALTTAKAAVDEWLAAREDARQQRSANRAERGAAPSGNRGSSDKSTDEGPVIDNTSPATPASSTVSRKKSDVLPSERRPPASPDDVLNFPALSKRQASQDSSDDVQSKGSDSSPTTPMDHPSSATSWSKIVKDKRKKSSTSKPHCSGVVAVSQATTRTVLDKQPDAVTVSETTGDAISVVSDEAPAEGNDLKELEDLEAEVRQERVLSAMD